MIKSAFVSISIAFLSTFVVLTVSAQEKLPPIHHAPDREFHAINIDLSLKFDLQKKEVFGTAVEKIVPLRVNFDTVHLDAVDMTIDKVCDVR